MDKNEVERLYQENRRKYGELLTKQVSSDLKTFVDKNQNKNECKRDILLNVKLIPETLDRLDSAQ